MNPLLLAMTLANAAWGCVVTTIVFVTLATDPPKQ